MLRVRAPESTGESKGMNALGGLETTMASADHRVEQRWATYRLLEVSDEVIPVLVLLQASEGHLCTGDVL